MVVACVFGPLERYLFLREACCWEALLPEQPPCIVAALRCRRCLLLCCPEQLLLYCNGSSGLVSSNAIAKPCRPTSKHPSRIVPTLDSPPAAIRCIAAASRYLSASDVPPALMHCSGSALLLLPSKQFSNLRRIRLPAGCCPVCALSFLSLPFCSELVCSSHKLFFSFPARYCLSPYRSCQPCKLRSILCVYGPSCNVANPSTTHQLEQISWF